MADDDSSSNHSSVISNYWYYNYRYYIDNPTTDYSTDREYVEVSATSIQKKWKRYMSVDRAAKTKVASILGSRWRRKKRIKLLRARRKK